MSNMSFYDEQMHRVNRKASKFSHKITQNLSCDAENIIYNWTCIKSNYQDFLGYEYIGESKTTFQKRFPEDRDYIKSEKISEPTGEHFNKKGHSV